MAKPTQTQLFWFITLIGTLTGALPLMMTTLVAGKAFSYILITAIGMVIFFIPASLILSQLVCLSIWKYEYVKPYTWFFALPFMYIPYWLFAQLNNSLARAFQPLMTSFLTYFLLEILVVAWLLMNIFKDHSSKQFYQLSQQSKHSKIFQHMFQTYLASAIIGLTFIILMLSAINGTKNHLEFLLGVFTSPEIYGIIIAFMLCGFRLCQQLQQFKIVSLRHYINKIVVIMVMTNLLLVVYSIIMRNEGLERSLYLVIAFLVLYGMQTPLCVLSAIFAFWVVKHYWLIKHSDNQ